MWYTVHMANAKQKKNAHICAQCGRKVTGNTDACPWCHAPMPDADKARWTDDSPYGVLALVFSVVPIVGYVFGALALSRNAGRQRTMGKIGLTITSIVHFGLILFGVLALNLYIEAVKTAKLSGLIAQLIA